MSRKTSSGGLFSRIMKFFGISSPAMLLIVVLGYFGIKVPGSSTELKETQEKIEQAKETVKAALTKGKELLKEYGPNLSPTQAAAYAEADQWLEEQFGVPPPSEQSSYGRRTQQTQAAKPIPPLQGTRLPAGVIPPATPVSSQARTPQPLPPRQPVQQPQPQPPPEVKKPKSKFPEFNPFG